MDGRKMADLFTKIDEELIEGSERYIKNNKKNPEGSEKTDIELIARSDKNGIDKTTGYEKINNDEDMILVSKRRSSYIAVAIISLGVVIAIAAIANFLVKDDKNGVVLSGGQSIDKNTEIKNDDNTKIKDDKNTEFDVEKFLDGSKSQYRAILELMSFKNVFPEFDEKESKKIGNELSEEEKKAQKNTSRFIGYRKLTIEQSAALKEVQNDIRYKNKEWSYDWLPYKEFHAIGEIGPLEKRMTLDEAKQIIEEASYFDDAVNKFRDKQILPDFAYDYSTTLKYEYWLDDEGSKAIVIQGNDLTQVKMNSIPQGPIIEREFIFYVEREQRAESAWVTYKRDVLAVYDPDLRKLSSDELSEIISKREFQYWLMQSEDFSEK